MWAESDAREEPVSLRGLIVIGTDVMQPYSLCRAASRRVTGDLLMAVEQLDITSEQHRSRLGNILGWFAGERCIYLPTLQRLLNVALKERFRCRHNPEVYLTCMFALCPRVTLNEMKVQYQYEEFAEYNWNLTIESEKCQAILEVIEQYLNHLSSLEGLSINDDDSDDEPQENNGSPAKRKRVSLSSGVGTSENKRAESTEPCLPTKSLVLESVFFDMLDFLPKLITRMSRLQHVSLEDYTLDTIESLSRHCRELNSMCFLDHYGHVVCYLFGVSLTLVTHDLLQRFIRDGEDFRKQFVPRFPNLKVLHLQDLEIDEHLRHCLQVLVLVLQPKLVFIGKDTVLNLHDVTYFRKAWAALHGSDPALAVLPLTRVGLETTLCYHINSLESFAMMIPLANLTSVELTLWDAQMDWFVSLIRKLASSNIKTMVINILPLEDLSCLSFLKHFRMMVGDCSLDTVHNLLDCCPGLTTLIIDPPLISSQNQDEVATNLPATQHRVRYGTHGLTLLRFNAISAAPMDEMENFLETLLPRLTNLNRLCIGTWLGQPGYYGSGSLVTVFAKVVKHANTFDMPLLTQLHQLCLHDLGTFGSMACGGMHNRDVCDSLISLIQLLPSLHCLTLPVIKELAPLLRHFRHSDTEIRHDCWIEESYWFE